jgi:mono/diheme cytochrome c family protein
VIRVRPSPRLVRAAALSAGVLVLAACQQRMAHAPYHRPLTESEFYSDKRSARPLEDGVVHRAQILDDDPLASGLTAEGKKEQTIQILNDDGTPKETKTGPGIPNRKENFVSAFPFQLTEADLKRGQERYQIFCMPCHSPTGNGRGKIVERGFLEPPSFHTDAVDSAEAAYRAMQRDKKQQPIQLGFSRGFAFYNQPVPLREVPPGYIFEVITKGYGGMPEYAAQIPIADRWRIVAYVKALQLSQNRAETERALGGKK